MLVRQSATYLAGKLIPAAMTFGLIALYTRLLSPEDYGVFAFVNATVTLVFSLSSMWLCTSAVRLYGRAQDKAPIQWSLAVGFGAVAGAVLVASVIAVPFLASGRDRLLLALGFLLFVLTAWFEINADILTARLKATTCVAMGVLRTALTGLLGGLLAWAGFGVEGILTGAVIGLAIPAAYMTATQWRGFRVKPVHMVELKALLLFGMPLSLSYAINAIVYSTDRYIVSAFGGAAVLGLYAVGFDLADRLVKSITQPLGTAALPILIQRFEREGAAGARDQAGQNLTLLAAIATPACLGLIAITPEFAELMLGSAYRAMADEIVPVIALTALFGGLRGQYFDHAFHLGLRTRLHVAVVAIMAGVNLAAGIVLVQMIGPKGAAYGTLLAYAAGLGASILLGRRAFALPVMAGTLIRIGIAGLLMMAAAMAVDAQSTALALILKIGAGAAVYVVLIAAFDVGGLRRVILNRLFCASRPAPMSGASS